MPQDDPSDDAVVKLLMADERNAGLRFARIGLGQLLPQRATKEGPKPNTRFLRNVIRETESHNAALLRSSAHERRSSAPEREHRSRRTREGRDDRRRSRSPPRNRDRRYRSRSRSRERRGHRSGETRRRSPRRDGGRERHRRRESRDDRSRSPDRKSRRPRRRRSASREETPLRGGSARDSDSVGPSPPRSVRRRGRGTFTESREMDRHFAEDYDPAADVRPEDEEVVKAGEDWETAREEFRIRQKWRQQGAERLRAAGFSEEQVERWRRAERGGEKDEQDVRWNKEGEGREWDRGKVIDGRGGVVQRPEWARREGRVGGLGKEESGD